MKSFIMTAVAFTALFSAAAADDDRAARIEFVNEFIRELITIQGVRDGFVKDHAQDKTSSDQMATFIRTSTRMNLELQANVNMLQGIKLGEQFSKCRDYLQDIYKQKQSINAEIISTASQFMVAAPKPGVDYEALAAHLPQLTAKDGYLDKIIFDGSVGIFLALVDKRADKQGHASHLIITKDQRKQMIRQIEMAFGSKLDEKDQPYIISSAWLIREGLRKDYKSSDDPW
jgi:hypothetical protein